MAYEIDNNDFIAVDEHDDCMLAHIWESKWLTISTQKNNSAEAGKIVSMDMDDIIAFRDWLNRSFPDA